MFLNIIGQPFQMLGQISTTFQSVMASTERVFAILDAPEEMPDPKDCITSEENIKGDIVFDHVYFSYTPDKPLIEDMNLTVHQGETVAIVGPTGAGKTTLVNLIMRFYEIDKGTILLDGVDTRNYARKTLRGAIGMVLQDTWLYNGTIRENIRYGNNEATDEDVYAAAKAARVDHFIGTLPGGYDFVLNEDGSNISQGQRQLITIARAICSKPKIMILDEATSSVDTRTEKAIQDAMDDIMVNRTSFVIAHRLSTIKNAKAILVMNQGKIIEMGTHNELMAKKGFYADLYNSQFLGKQEDSANLTTTKI
jgi:ATP-binding cassette subfamily B protein